MAVHGSIEEHRKASVKKEISIQHVSTVSVHRLCIDCAPHFLTYFIHTDCAFVNSHVIIVFNL